MKISAFYKKLSASYVAARVMAAFAVGLLFPFMAWILDAGIHNEMLTAGNIASAHVRNPIHFLVDLFPFLFALITYGETRRRNADRKSFNEHLRRLEENYLRNATFAREIGSGNFHFQYTLSGEDDILGKALLVMRDNLLANSRKEQEQNWIAEGKELISNILRIHNKIDELSYEVIANLIKYINAIQGALYFYDEEKNLLVNVATYAYNRKKYVQKEFRIGQGLIGQCAYERDFIYRTEIPDDYMTITSGILGDRKPRSLLIVPLITDEKLQGVIEVASLEDHIPELTIRFMRELAEIIARTLFNLRVNQQTENLLRQAQKITEELRESEEQLRMSAEEMKATQEQLQITNKKLEAQIREVENAQKRLHSLLENASEIIFIYDENMMLKFVSPSVTRILGYTPSEMMKGKDLQRITRRGEAELRAMFSELIKNPSQPQTLQYTYMKKDGERIFLETTGRNLLDDPAIQGILMNTRDITARKKAEKEERLKSKMQSLSENSPDLILRLSPAGQFFYVNPMIEKYTGLAPREVTGRTIEDIGLNEVLLGFFRSAINEMKESPAKVTREVALTNETPDGKTHIYLSFDAIPEIADNELESVLFVGHDVTEAKNTHREIEEKNRKIQDSINYARRIQQSIIPDNKTLRQHLPKSFLLYQARDVVSGDFPWLFRQGDILYLAAIDCTGHGVPGAMLSFIAYFLLNNIATREKEISAAHLLDLLHEGVRNTLRQHSNDTDARDGMDVALVRIDLNTQEVHFAGAHRPLYLLRSGEITQFKGDLKAIGGIPVGKKTEKPFTNHSFKALKGDRIFFFTDGLTDQLGGPDKSKYGNNRVRELILQYRGYTMPEYSDLFARDFREWTGNEKQLDDVLMIGIEF